MKTIQKLNEETVANLYLILLEDNDQWGFTDEEIEDITLCRSSRFDNYTIEKGIELGKNLAKEAMPISYSMGM